LEFQKFPPEIREKILKLVLETDGDSGGIEITRGSKPRRIQGLALFLTSKAMFDEACSIFYREKRFVSSSRESNQNLTRFLSDGRARYIRHLAINISSKTAIVDLLRSLEHCQELRTITLFLEELPLFYGREKYQVATLKKLKFKKPGDLKKITVNAADKYGGNQIGGELFEACRILQSVLQNGLMVEEVG
jgi:hypothetical protein